MQDFGSIGYMTSMAILLAPVYTLDVLDHQQRTSIHVFSGTTGWLIKIIVMKHTISWKVILMMILHRMPVEI